MASPYTGAQAGGGLQQAAQILAPDIATQQIQLARQQQFADLLKQQGTAKDHPTEVINGWAVKQSPMQGISQILNAIGGQVMQKNIDSKQMALAQALNQRIFGGGPAPQADPSAALSAGAQQNPSTPDASGAMVNAGGVGPTPQNAAAMAQQQPQAAPQGVAGNFFSMPGMDSRQVQLAFALNPDAMTKALIEQHAPTDLSKMGMQGGMTPEQIQAANVAGLNKATNMPLEQLRQGSIGLNPITKLPQVVNPHLPMGAMPQFDQNGNITGAAQVPGAPNAAQQMALAEASGKAQVTPVTGFNPQTGEAGFTNALTASGNQPIPGAQGAAPVGNTGAFKNYTPAGGSQPLVPQANPGVTAAAGELATANAKNYSGLQNLASTSPDRANMLDNMMELAKGATQFGPGWEGRMERVASINSALPSGMALGSNDMANAQILQKYMSNLIQQNQKALGGTGTDQQMAMIQHGTPSPDMMNKAMVDVIPKLKAQELALQAKANAANDFMSQNNNNPAALNKFENNWRQNYDPRIYQMQQMAPAERAAFMQKQPDAAALRGKAQTALSNGWVK